MPDDHDDDQSYPELPAVPPHRRSQYDFNSKIMLTAIISLSVVVVIVTILHIYARYVLRRQARRRAAMRQLRLAVSQAHSGTEPPKTGLDPAVIASLPIFVYKQTNKNNSHDEKEDAGQVECAVCLSILEDDEMARLLPNCKHTFHAECIDKWLGSQSTCPICRTEAQPRLSPEEPQERAVAGGGASPPTAPPLERVNSTIITSVESTSDGVSQPIAKVNESSLRLSSFRRMLSRDRLSPRIQSCGQEDGLEDLERQ